MLGAGTIINPILKIVTTVAILAAVYFFIIEPTLDTTEEISRSATESSRNIQESVSESINQSLNQSNQQVKDAIKDAQEALDEAGISGGEVKAGGNPTDLLECIQDASGDVEAIQACTK